MRMRSVPPLIRKGCCFFASPRSFSGSIRSLINLWWMPALGYWPAGGSLFSTPSITDEGLGFNDVLHPSQDKLVLQIGRKRVPDRFGHFLHHAIIVHSTSLADIKSLATVPYPESFHGGQLT